MRALGLLLVLALVSGGCTKAATFELAMQDSAMEPTLLAHTIVRFGAPAEASRGDVVAFEYPFAYPGRPRRALIARLIGLPGDRLALGPGGVEVNGRPLDEPYAKNQDRVSPVSVVVPPASYFLLGDDRNNQRDSRWLGTLPAEKLLGVAAR